jgi:hypothetical protein
MQPLAALSLLHSRPRHAREVNAERPEFEARPRRLAIRSKRV